MNNQPVQILPSGAAGGIPPAGRMADVEDDEINLRELFDLLWSGKWVVIAVAAAVTMLGLVHALTATPIYSASGLVQVEEEEKGLGQTLNDLSSMLTGAAVQTPAELAILQSRMVLGEVAERLKLRLVAQPRYFPLFGAAYVRRQKPLEAPAEPLLGLDGFAWGGERIAVEAFEVPDALQDQAFTLRATQTGFDLHGPEDEKILSGRVGESATGQTEAGPVRIFVQELQARPQTEFALAQRSLQSLFGYMHERLSVAEEGKDSGIIRITYEDDDPALAAQVVSEIQQAYLRQNVERRSKEAEQSLEFLNKQLPEVKAKVDEAQARLNAYQLQQGTADVQKETELVLNQAVGLETERLSLSQQREVALQRFTPNHPIVQALDEQLNALDAQLNRIRTQVEALPERQQEIFSLMRDLEVNTQLYVALLNSAQQLQVTKAGTVGNVRVIDAALIPREPTKPKKSLIVLLSIVLGGFLGVVLVFLQRMMLRGVDRPEDVEKALGLPTYASIPYSHRQQKLDVALRKGGVKNGILASISGEDHAIEALRSLRTALHFAMLDSPNNVVMLTGPVPDLGKTFVSINLGAVLALAGKKVVVVDADLRRGRVHQYLGESSAPGVSDYVAGTAGTIEDVLRPTAVPDLYALTRGVSPPNPAEVLLNERFASLIQQLSRAYDYVIIDTPPVLPVADAAIIGRLAGATLMVLKAAEHPMRSIEESQRRLRNAGVEVRGVLFNQVGAKIGSYGYGYYGYAYGYGGYSYRSTAAAR